MQKHHLTSCTAAFAVILTLWGASAQALAPCDAVVVDTAGVLKNIPAVETAAATLARETGAEVRVRIAPNHAPEANLDRHVEAIADNVCESWTNEAGSRRSNLLIYWVTMDRQVGLYYGNLWQSELDRQWPTVLERKVKPLLRDGNFDQAFISGMSETARVIKVASEPAPSIVERQVVRVEQREPTDWTPLAAVLGLIALLVFIIAALRYGLLPAWKQYGRNRAMREEARGVLAQCYQEFQHLNGYTERLVTILGEAHRPTSAPAWANARVFAGWQHKLALLLQKANASNTRFLALESGPLNNAGTYNEYSVVRDNLASNHKELVAISTELAALETTINDEEHRANTIDIRRAAVYMAEKAAQSSIDRAQSNGFKTDFVKHLLQEAAAQTELGDKEKGDKSYVKAETHFLDAIEQYQQVGNELTNLPTRRDQLRSTWNELTTRRHELSDRAGIVRKTLQTLEASYAKETFELVKGNGTEAEKRLTAVPEMAQAIGGLLEEQSWDQAQAALETAGAVLDDATSLLDSLDELTVQLETAAFDAREEVTEAERSIEVALQFLSTNPEYDSNEARATLADAAVLCKAVRQELAKPRPNVLTAFEQAVQADDLADAVYNQAASEKEQAERLQRRVERERREALAEFDKVERYFRNHRSDIGHTARRKLDTAKELAAQARNHTDASLVLQVLQELADARKNAYRQAKSDFDSAESERAAARRRRNDSSSSYGSSSSWGSSSSSSSSFGGGSSGFGSGGGGFGGGSSSW